MYFRVSIQVLFISKTFQYFHVCRHLVTVIASGSVCSRNLLLRQVKAWVKRLKDPPQRMQRSSLMTQKDPSKGFHKDMIRHISLK